MRAVFFGLVPETTRRISMKVGIWRSTFVEVGAIELSSVVPRHEAAMTEAVQSQESWQGREIFLFNKTSRSALASLRLLVIWNQWVSSREKSDRSVKLTTYRLVPRLKIYISVPPFHMMPF